MKLVRRLALSFALTTVIALALTSVALAIAGAPAPTGFFSGNINSCSSGDKSVEAVLGLQGSWSGAGSGGWPAAHVSGDGLDVTISNVTTAGGQLFFDWSSNLPVDLAVVKQGPGGAYWLFAPASTSGTLASYKNGAPSDGISHVLFCSHPGVQKTSKLLVSKTAETAVEKTYSWSISKKEKDGRTQFSGEVGGAAGTANYEIAVTKQLAETLYTVAGEITVKNDSTTDLVAVTVGDTLPGSSGLVLDLACTGPFALAAGATKTCSYSATLPNSDTRTNTATAASGSVGVVDGSGTATVVFDDSTPVAAVNDSIAVSDDFATPGSTADDRHWTSIGSTTTLVYDHALTCGGDGGSTVLTNTASIDGTNQSSSWTITTVCRAKEVGSPVINSVTTPPATTPATTTPATTPPAAVTPPVTTTPATTTPPFTPPVVKSTPKPKPVIKAGKVEPVACTVVKVGQKAIRAGQKSALTIRLTAAGRPVVGASVRIVGPSIDRVGKSGKNGVVVLSVSPTRAGIVIVSVIGKKSCSSARFGIVGTFEPPVAG